MHWCWKRWTWTGWRCTSLETMQITCRLNKMHKYSWDCKDIVTHYRKKDAIQNFTISSFDSSTLQWSRSIWVRLSAKFWETKYIVQSRVSHMVNSSGYYMYTWFGSDPVEPRPTWVGKHFGIQPQSSRVSGIGLGSGCICISLICLNL